MKEPSESGGMPPKRRMPGSHILEDIAIKRNIVVANGKTTYEGVPTFDRGAHNLWVFVNGKKEYCGDHLDYIELSSNTIRFNKVIPKGAVIEFLVFESFKQPI